MSYRTKIEHSILVLCLLGAATVGASELALGLTSGPAEGEITASTKVAFSFVVGRESVARCSLDGETARLCESPVEYRGLDDGPHRFVVTAESTLREGTMLRTEHRSWIVASEERSGLTPTVLPASGDVDGDGVANGDDLCPLSLKGTRSFYRGCAMVEVAADPEVLWRPVAPLVAAARAAVDDVELFGPDAPFLSKALVSSEQAIHAGLAAVGAGELCQGAEAVTSAADALARANGLMQELVRERRQWLDQSVSLKDIDADRLDVQFQELGVRLFAFDQATRATTEVAQGVTSLCEAAATTRTLGARIAETLDDRGLVRLDDGLVLAVADAADLGAMNEGVEGEITAMLWEEGYGLAQSIKSSVVASQLPNYTIQCVLLRVAPFQRFSPPLPVSVNEIVLHNPNAYKVEGTLELEKDMRLGALSGGCPLAVGGGNPDDIALEVYRYSLLIEYKPDGGSWMTVASDLTAGEHPVKLPTVSLPTATAPKNGTLRSTVQVQTCDNTFTSNCSVATPLSTATYDVRVHTTGSLAALQYSDTQFSLEDWDPNDYATTSVLGVTLAPTVAAATSVGFEGWGYASNGSKVVDHVTSTTPSFAVYTVDLVNPDALFGFASDGTSKRSGLRWPRAVGQRNGSTFWYSATPPDVVRDFVASCFGPASYYRYPWQDGVTKKVGQGNAPPSTGSHSTSGQQFAFDFGLSFGSTIRTTRGGTVEWLQESLTANFDPGQPISPTNQPFPPGNLSNWGNAVRIRHQDGSRSWYFHIQNNGVFVNVNEVVERGQPIALSGNTGRSGAPHLHYQVQASASNWGQTIPIAFGNCEVPVTNDDVTSNNWNPNFP